jgi:hypothetical protein
MVRAALVVSVPLCVALSVGGLAGIATVSLCALLGMELPERARAFPVIAFVVLFGFRGAVESAHRLARLLQPRDAP